MKSTAWQSFSGKIKQIAQNQQLSDIALEKAMAICRADMSDDKRINEVLGHPKTHAMLNHANNKHGIDLTFSSARKTLNETAIINIYRAYSVFLADIIRDLANVRPLDLVSHLQQQNQMLFKDIIDLGTYDKIISEMAVRVYRRLEAKRSDKDIQNAIISTFGLNISDADAEEARLYMNVRHLIIHNKGYADADFIVANKGRIKLDSSKRISMTNKLVSKTSVVIFKFVKVMFDEINDKVFNPTV